MTLKRLILPKCNSQLSYQRKEPRIKPFRIAILTFPGCLASELFGFRDVIQIADRMAEIMSARRIQCFLITINGKPVTTSGGESIGGKTACQQKFDLCIVPGFFLKRRSQIPEILKTCSAEITFLAGLEGTTAIASICVGTFLLAAAGLLDQRDATTAWYFADELQHCYPKVRVNKSTLLQKDGLITTTGAFTASFDLALNVIADICGTEVVRATRNLTLLDGARSSQSPFHDQTLIGIRSAPFSQDIEDWLITNMAEFYSLKRLAAAFNTSPRTLMRKYKSERKQTPLKFLQRVRIEAAKKMMEQSSRSIEQIGVAIGYQDIGAFRNLFKRLVGETPASYRRRFSVLEN
ncbi:helix-turn-helix domain-containing protein [Gammaproteobacteria bacterium]|nr:helix-turn-helix domain-containing protein [Gammaproteobacteria bacterium]